MNFKENKFFKKAGIIGIGAVLGAIPLKDNAQNPNTQNKDSLNIPFVSTPMGQELLKKYAFTLPGDSTYLESPDKYYDEIQYEKLPAEGLTEDQISDIMYHIKNPLDKIPNQTIAPTSTENSDIVHDIKELDPELGNNDIANIGKYKLNKNLEPKKPFGYGENNDGVQY